MDKEKLSTIANALEEIFSNGKPTDEELDFDDDTIELYDALWKTKESLENIGIM